MTKNLNVYQHYLTYLLKQETEKTVLELIHLYLIS
ncbi:hypothetical protein C8P67_104135 [Flavobacterium aquicola]|uniref:Uncharacterized protein n=1 Tax=Flavobacterium aquicola TaxID=1682742 RepID=A0A3E0EMR4_9FLAO|nr:hypothetical protein C8P67_104135 [Flavobacterium aquicola]